MDGMDPKSQNALAHELECRPGRAEPNNLRDQVAVREGLRLWPTPTVQDSENNGGPSQYNRNSIPLNALVKMLPTPKAQDAKHGNPTQYEMQNRKDDLHVFAGGSLNPEWVEWLMGYPVGWTACGVSETRSSRKSSKK
jgi:hypothetical protein